MRTQTKILPEEEYFCRTVFCFATRLLHSHPYSIHLAAYLDIGRYVSELVDKRLYLGRLGRVYLLHLFKRGYGARLIARRVVDARQPQQGVEIFRVLFHARLPYRYNAVIQLKLRVDLYEPVVVHDQGGVLIHNERVARGNVASEIVAERVVYERGLILRRLVVRQLKRRERLLFVAGIYIRDTELVEYLLLAGRQLYGLLRVCECLLDLAKLPVKAA